MKASAIEFRLRMVIMVAIVALGFWSPWIAMWGLGVRTPLLEWLALELSRMGLMSFTVAAPAVIVLGSVFAAVGAFMRVWGAAYLGYGTVHHAEMQAGAVMADGPFRFVRNPLYIGGWFMFVAMAFLMPPTGALFSMTLLTVFLWRLILGEEEHLFRHLGEPYKKYLCSVPRLFPRLRTNLPAAGQEPHWLVALFTEVNPIGVFITLAFLSWSYDHLLMLKGILISLGVSLVVRALMPRGHGKPDPV
ncbi:MAG TPA: methyltransferase [Terracidiphilus sp.]|jgi:protein-S-isoprenylcysteine O-methyltransferase Ste14|nr:methyltransferase [Terracidiphilus sp.]